ncbi:MAG: hypothetical protein AAF944_24185 [Bacteroidota bacterium]
MNTEPSHHNSRFSFFSQEPKFSTWIILGTLVLLSVVLIYLSCDYQTPFSDLFCSHANEKVKITEVLNFNGFWRQITSELGRMPK